MSAESYPHLGSAVVPDETLFPQIAEDLRTLSAARNYHAWLYAHIEGALGRRIVEIGAGIGTYTPLLLAHGEVWATEPEPAYLSYLRRRFATCDRLTVIELAIGDWSEQTRERIRQLRPDTFVCLNVLEHVDPDAAAVGAMYDCLEPGGHLALILPALPALYSPLDRRYGHYRRYAKRDVTRLTHGLRGARIVRCRYFNAAGALGWWVNHVVLRRERLPKAQTLLFDRLIVPLAAGLERLLPPPVGLSLAVWIRKGA